MTRIIRARGSVMLIIAAFASGLWGAVSAQPLPADALAAMLAEPMPRVPAALGSFSHQISSESPEVQAYFDQGYQLMYAYGKYEAVRSFREAHKLDPECAICFWGEAWAWGSYLNFPMSADEAPYAYAAIQKALELRDKATPREQAYVDALAARYVPDYDFERRREQDEAYVAAARSLAERFPDDLDAVTHYADALFLLEPRRGNRDLDDPNVQRLHAVLESVLARDIRHIGACHLYIHATESTPTPELAEPCTEFLGTSIPGASHINHMPSHTWNEIGRWGDSVRANLHAWQSDLKAAIGEGVQIYPPHNLHMLFFAASFDGQGAIATRAGKDYAKLTGDESFRLLTLLRFGRFDEILEVTEQADADFPAGIWDFAQGYARLKMGEADFARVHLQRLAELAETTETMFRFHRVGDLLTVLEEILAGEMQWQQGNLRAAIAAFERSVEHEDALQYDEPEPFPFAARHWLGAALLEDERYRDAELVYRDELDDHPHNGWSLFGLRAALGAQRKTDAAVDQDFDQSWARADVWITSSRF